MRDHFFLHYGWFFQNLRKEAVRTLMHTTVYVDKLGRVLVTGKKIYKCYYLRNNSKHSNQFLAFQFYQKWMLFYSIVLAQDRTCAHYSHVFTICNSNTVIVTASQFDLHGNRIVAFVFRQKKKKSCTQQQFFFVNTIRFFLHSLFFKF